MIESYHIDAIDKGEVLRYLGYRGQELAQDLARRIDGAIEHCVTLAKPRASIRLFDVSGRTPQPSGMPAIQLAGTMLELQGRSIAAHLAEATIVGVMAVTIGMDIERELRRLSLTDRVEQLLLDSAATALVERAADAAEASIVAKAAGLGLHGSSRFSPGYGDLPLATQPMLLAALDAQRRLGVTLTPSLLMTPTKSVTAVVGLCPTPQASAQCSCVDCHCRSFCTLRATTGRTCRG